MITEQTNEDKVKEYIDIVLMLEIVYTVYNNEV